MFSHCMSIGANDLRSGTIFDSGAWLAGFIKRSDYTLLHKNIKALGFVVSEKKIFLCFTHDAPGAGPV